MNLLGLHKAGLTPTEIVFGGASTTPAMNFASNPDSGTPGMGSSVGMIGGEGGGTLDGFVSLKRVGKVGTVIITSHHVVRPDLKSQSQAAIVLINQFGYGSVNTASMTGTVQYPAMTDLEATGKDLVNKILPAAVKSIKDTVMIW